MMKGKQWLVIVLAVVILGTIAVGVAVADNAPVAGQPSQNLAQAFLGNLASALHIDQTTLTNALQTASTQTLSQEVASGKITQQQADQIQSRISSGKLPLGFLGTGFGKQRSVAGSVYGKRGKMGSFMILKPLASALGITQKVLMSDLRGGQTISALAAAKGTTVTALQSTILSSIQSQLTSAVSSGKMTQTQETQIYTKLEQTINANDWTTQLEKACQTRSNQKTGGQQVSQ